MNKTIKGMLFATALLGGLVLSSTISNEKAHASELDGVWTARTVDQIKADISGNQYTIKWGDTVSGISQATNVSESKIQELNSIKNINLIYAGDTLTLVFDGNEVSVVDQSGTVQEKTTVTEAEKVVPNAPIGEKAPTPSTNSNVGNDTTPSDNGNAGNDTTPSDNGNAGNNTTPSDNGNAGNDTTPSDNGNNGNNGNNENNGNNGNNGNNENNGNNGNNGNNENNGNNGNNGNNENNGNNGNNGNNENKPDPIEQWTVWYTADEDHSKDIALGAQVFNTRDEARAWIENYADGLLEEGITSANYGTQSWTK